LLYYSVKAIATVFSSLYGGPKHEKVQQRLLGVLWDTVKIFPHTPKHGTDERLITLPIQRSMFIIN